MIKNTLLCHFQKAWNLIELEEEVTKWTASVWPHNRPTDKNTLWNVFCSESSTKWDNDCCCMGLKRACVLVFQPVWTGHYKTSHSLFSTITTEAKPQGIPGLPLSSALRLPQTGNSSPKAMASLCVCLLSTWSLRIKNWVNNIVESRSKDRVHQIWQTTQPERQMRVKNRLLCGSLN